ncbi:hypothetical protein EDC04DRAFT_337099 [Pisolithus marmoratus]|nr:hypothetical protein EDC04DRAFT_337099 [Pisolithus marmoratus]
MFGCLGGRRCCSLQPKTGDPLSLVAVVTLPNMTRGNQRETDRAKAAKKQAAINKSKPKESNASLAKRREADAEILRAKQKACQGSTYSSLLLLGLIVSPFCWRCPNLDIQKNDEGKAAQETAGRTAKGK